MHAVIRAMTQGASSTCAVIRPQRKLGETAWRMLTFVAWRCSPKHILDSLAVCGVFRIGCLPRLRQGIAHGNWLVLFRL